MNYAAAQPFERSGCLSPYVRDIRQMLLDCARSELRKKSYKQFSVERLANAANLTCRTIYRYFSSKSELYELSRKSLIYELMPVVLAEVPPAMSPADAVIFALRGMYDLHSDPRMHELRHSMEADRLTQPWLVPLVEQFVRVPSLRAVEFYILRQCRHAPLPPDGPAHIAHQMWILAEGLAIEQRKSRKKTQAVVDCELHLAAKAFSAILPDAIGA